MNKQSARDAQLERLVREAYNEGFIEGMREYTSKGGNSWRQSSSCKKLAVILAPATTHTS